MAASMALREQLRERKKSVECVCVQLHTLTRYQPLKLKLHVPESRTVSNFKLMWILC